MITAKDIERIAHCNEYHADGDRKVLIHKKLGFELPYNKVRIVDGFKIGFKPVVVK